MKIHLQGTINKIFPAEIFGAEKNITVRKFLLEEMPKGKYPSIFEIRVLHNEKNSKYNRINEIDKFKIGTAIEFDAFLNGKIWKSKTTGKEGVMNEISLASQIKAVGTQPPAKEADTPPQSPINTISEDDDFPF